MLLLRDALLIVVVSVSFRGREMSADNLTVLSRDLDKENEVCL